MYGALIRLYVYNRLFQNYTTSLRMLEVVTSHVTSF